MKETIPNQKQMLAYRLYKVTLNSTKENLKTDKGLKETVLPQKSTNDSKHR